jgi:UDP-galactopyranose mutase
MIEWLKKEQIHYKDPPKNSEEMSFSRVGRRLYEKMFKPYTIKQWAKSLPTNGYTAIFEKMFENPLITVETNVDYFDVKDAIKCGPNPKNQVLYQKYKKMSDKHKSIGEECLGVV